MELWSLGQALPQNHSSSFELCMLLITRLLCLFNIGLLRLIIMVQWFTRFSPGLLTEVGFGV